MLRLAERVTKIFIVCGYTDMRRSIDGLAGIVKQNYSLKSFSGDLLLFCGKRRNRMKTLLWDEDGFYFYTNDLQRFISMAENSSGSTSTNKVTIHMAYAGTINRPAKSN